MFEEIISLIKPLDVDAMEKCQVRLDNLTKPLGSLHSFEHIAKQMAGITGNPRPKFFKKSIIVLAGDHGVMTEGISLYPSTATAEMLVACSQGAAGVSVFAKHVSADLVLVDIGVETDLPASLSICKAKIGYGTKNIAKQPAMTRDEVIAAIQVGINIAQTEIKKGSAILGIGAIGVGSTISSAAIIACYSGKKGKELLGTGTGISEELLAKRIDVVEKVLLLHQLDSKDALDMLSKLGGFEIAGLVGVIIGAAAGGAAVVLDGLATSTAAVLAARLAPQVKDYLIASHFAVEPAQQISLDLISLPGYLHLGMHGGEGTGAALGISLINASLHVLNDMKTFGEAEVAVAQDGPGALKQSKDVI